MNRHPIAILIVLFLFCSCKRSDGQVQIEEKGSNKEIPIHEFDEIGDEPEEGDVANYNFPTIGRKASDFCPADDFEIQYEAEGDLNEDGLTDIAIVLRHRGISRIRPILILLQKADDESYYLYKKSDTAFPSGYDHKGDYFPYDTEDIAINDGCFMIHLYGMGARGNLSSIFRYAGDELTLSNIESYNAGAGSQQLLKYDVEDGVLIQTVINTMEENMPEETRTFHLEKAKYLFENASPEDIIIGVYSKTDVN